MEHFTASQPNDKDFSLGLTYYEIMKLPVSSLSSFLEYSTREEVIDWLQWNDPNGVYADKASLAEFGTILSKEEGIELIKQQIIEG